MDKLTTKQAIKEVLIKYFDNNEQITDELLFDGKKLTLEAYQLLREATSTSCRVADTLDVLGYHCYIEVDVRGDLSKDGYDIERKKILMPIINKITKKLESIIGDGCYLISDCISGGRDGFGEAVHYGNYNHSWGSDTTKESIDIWVFDQCAAALDFIEENNEMKCKLLFDRD